VKSKLGPKVLKDNTSWTNVQLCYGNFFFYNKMSAVRRLSLASGFMRITNEKLVLSTCVLVLIWS
jgi:hypothetical protein